jgi:hypothetical protein
MITKEELLQKGIDPATADEILASMDRSNDSPLQALKKAMSGESEEQTLFKAFEKPGDDEDDKEPDGDGDDYSKKYAKKHMKKSDDGDEDDEDDEGYDEEYMKKYMKKYMKANKALCKADAEEVGLFDKEMKKAIENMDMDAEGAVVEMTDLAPFLDAQISFNSKMAKAISSLVNRIEVIAQQNAEGYSLLHKASAVQVEMAEIFAGISKTPMGRKGAIVADMNKARVSQVDTKTVWNALAKAINSGDLKAGAIGSKFESSGKRFDFLTSEEQGYVKELIGKEA